MSFKRYTEKSVMCDFNQKCVIVFYLASLAAAAPDPAPWLREAALIMTSDESSNDNPYNVLLGGSMQVVVYRTTASSSAPLH